MRRRIALFFFLTLIAAATIAVRPHSAASHPSSRQSPALGSIQHVIVVTIDGMKPQTYTEPDAHGLKVPTLREIVRTGASSDGVQPVMPSVTYPSHTTMMTGVNPGTHAIFTNPEWDPLGKNEKGWRWYEEDIRVPTLWQLAHDRGLRTALIHWPVTVGAQADILVPEYWRAMIPEDLKLLRALSTRGILDDVAKEFPDFIAGMTPFPQTDEAFTDIACYAIEKLQPNLLILHLAMLDHQEHEHGPFSPEAIAATETADSQIARVIAESKKSGIWNSTALVVLSDHGFVPLSQAVRPGVLLRKHGLITLDAKDKVVSWKASLISNAGSAYIYVRDKNDDVTRRALLHIFQPLAAAPGSRIHRVVGHDEIVALGGDPEAFLALEAVEGATISGDYTGVFTGSTKVRGTHGYFPDRSEMRSSLLIYGPSIAPGKIENARMIDVAPTIARWLALDLSKAQGSPLAILQRAAAQH
ncbi:MAG: ectonucleotide pyrophosphatase/phosphodiesterase [Candidatus Acidiferrales bacterium]